MIQLLLLSEKPSPDAAPLEVRLRRAEERYNEAKSDFSSAEARLDSAETRLDAAISYVKDADSKLNDALAERSLESEKVIAELNKRIEALEKKLGWRPFVERELKPPSAPWDSCCVVTGPPGPLEGCHIVQRALWKAAKTQYHRDSVVDMGDWNETYSGCYDVRNGVLLSRDIHELFDDHFFTIIEKEVDGARTFELLIHESKIEWFKQVKNIENGQRIVFGGHPDLWPTKENLEIRRLLFEQHHLCHQDSFQTLQHDDGSEDPAADPLETHLMKAPFSIQSDEPATADCRTDSMESPPLKLEKSADWTETWVMDIRRQMAAGVQMSGALHN
ncbi:hypothetical protein DFJ73DRAFT_756493 [Zopfochytrium polystomum]|nr:hypothetical protein DFJ73DRAFT_756493 [Zopfochytrium polystomum]